MNSRRAALLDKIRRDHNRAAGALTPAERIRRADEMRTFARGLRSPGVSRSDESASLLIEIRRKVRGD